MRKLILILICLFVSFEVKSKSDDLSDKKLLCNDSISINELYSMVGFEFFNREMIFYQLRTTSGVVNIFKGEYKNKPKTITFSFSELDNFLLELDRQDLTINLKGDDVPLYICEELNGDLEIYFNNLQKKIKDELKSKLNSK